MAAGGAPNTPGNVPPPFTHGASQPADSDGIAVEAWEAPRRRPKQHHPGLIVRAWKQWQQARVVITKLLRGGFAGIEGKWWRDLLLESPPWLVSLVIHFTGIVVLGLLAVGVHQHIVKEIEVEIAPPEDYSKEVFAESLGSQLQQPMAGPILEEFNPLLDPSYSLSDLPAVDDPLAAPPIATEPGEDGSSLLSAIEAPSIGLALSGRQAGFKEALIAAYGGTRTTQQAVDDALKWLARQQRSDGLWSLRGPYQDGAFQENQLSATAMAMLAFLGDGKTHLNENPYRRNIQKALRALLKLQGGEGQFFIEETLNNHRLYTHAQCTIALCELFAMTEDSHVREAAARAVKYCIDIQSPQGGWRYFPGQDSDMSVTGWFVMALQSARMAGLEVPQDTLYRVGGFIDSVGDQEQILYSYVPHQVATPSMTAEAVLCRQYLGWQKDDHRLRASVDYLNDHPVNWEERNVYYWYYATQVLHHMGGEPWVKWNKVMRQIVPEHQVSKGRERGSWDPAGDQWGGTAGRLYTTCLSTYMLEVYYRHLPLYGAKLASQ